MVGSNQVVQELDKKVAAARETVTGAETSITSSSTSVVVEKVERTQSGAKVLTEVTVDWVYKDLGNAEFSDAGMTNYYLVTMVHGPNGLEVGDVEITTASEFGYEEWANHALGVTGRSSSGVPRVSQKTPNRHNILVSTWLQYAHDQFGEIKMYGLKDYFTF